MGMENKITFAEHNAPNWQQITALLAERDCPAEMRMIDGELAFPDETPPEDWRELRVGTPGGMISLRRETDGVAVVTWENADEEMLRSWRMLTWAVAKAAGGLITTGRGEFSADDYQREFEQR